MATQLPIPANPTGSSEPFMTKLPPTPLSPTPGGGNLDNPLGPSDVQPAPQSL